MLRSFKYRLYPTRDQAEILGQWVGVTRLVYNLALEQRRVFWRQFLANEGRSISMPSQGRELTALRKQYEWIEAVPRDGLDAALNDLDKAFGAFFKGGGYPKVRRLGENDSIRFRGRDMRLERLNAKWGQICFPKMGWVRVRLPRGLSGRPLTLTISRTAGQWFAAIAADVGSPPAQNNLPRVGIDRGVITTLSLSNGENIRLPDLGALEKRRRRAQRVLAKRKRGSRRYAAQMKSLAALSAKIGRVRSHSLHVASKNIASRFGVVALEDLNIQNMIASARGSVQRPGRNVRQKAGLNRSILSQGWGILASQLDYKLEAAGGRLIYVPAAYSSQTCSACGVVDAQSRNSQAVFACVHCGHRAHADTNAAIEILRRSTAIVEGCHSGRPVEAKTPAV